MKIVKKYANYQRDFYVQTKTNIFDSAIYFQTCTFFLEKHLACDSSKTHE